MIGIDTNLLLYALSPVAQEHEKAKEILESLADSTSLVIAELVLVELYLLIRNPVIVGKEITAKKAVEIIEIFRSNPKWQLVENAPVMDEVWRIVGRDGFARRKIFDVRLALTFQHHGVTHLATSNKKDFKDLGFERVWNPLIEEM